MTLFLATLLHVSSLSVSPGECPNGQIIGREEIEASGAMSFADVVQLFDTFRFVSTDGFTWEPFHGSGEPFGHGGLSVFIDGQEHSLSLFGRQDLNRLPVPLSLVASVEFCPSMRRAGGTFTRGGSLHIKTLVPLSGIHATGAWHIGNETGDPGPFRYTDQATRNVDKFGPDYEGSLSFRAGKTSVRVGGLFDQFYDSDIAVFPRSRSVTSVPAVHVDQTSAWADLRTSLLGGPFLAQATGLSQFYLWFFEPAGRELPVRHEEAAIRFAGALPVGRSLLGDISIGYRASFAHLDLAEEASKLPSFQPDWQQSTFRSSFEARATTERQFLALGASVQHVRAQAPSLNHTDLTTGMIYASRTRNSEGGLYQHTDAALVASESGIRLKLAQTLSRFLRNYNVELTAGVDGRLPEENPSYAYWFSQGYRGLMLSEVAQS
ncbi:MAG: hypothetical protein R3284_08845, partial [Rubricoccaceae bacterium]|nr:hypothetical protein [Rubricoccaceae bacterium]